MQVLAAAGSAEATHATRAITSQGLRSQGVLLGGRLRGPAVRSRHAPEQIAAVDRQEGAVGSIFQQIQAPALAAVADAVETDPGAPPVGIGPCHRSGCRAQRPAAPRNGCMVAAAQRRKSHSGDIKLRSHCRKSAGGHGVSSSAILLACLLVIPTQLRSLCGMVQCRETASGGVLGRGGSYMLSSRVPPVAGTGPSREKRQCACW